METIINPIQQLEKHESRSARYGFVKTDEILNILSKNNWNLVSEQRTNPRNPSKVGFQKHLLRFQNKNFPTIDGISENNRSIPELVLLNSHDGTSSFRLFFGLLRIACLNGIISGDKSTQIKINHSISSIKMIDDSVQQFTESIPNHIDLIKNLGNLKLSSDIKLDLIRKLFNYRLKNTRNLLKVDYDVDILRTEDVGTDAFTIMNVIQEKLIKGGINYAIKKSNSDSILIRRTRAINNISQNLELNQLIFNEFNKIAA